MHLSTARLEFTRPRDQRVESQAEATEESLPSEREECRRAGRPSGFGRPKRHISETWPSQARLESARHQHESKTPGSSDAPGSIRKRPAQQCSLFERHVKSRVGNSAIGQWPRAKHRSMIGTRSRGAVRWTSSSGTPGAEGDTSWLASSLAGLPRGSSREPLASSTLFSRLL